MQFFRAWRTGVVVTALCLCAQGQNPPSPNPPSKDAPVNETKGIPPRSGPNDYQAHGAAGTVTVAAEFLGHAVPIPEGPIYNSEDYVAVEVALYGASGARLKISSEDFSLRVYAKKAVPLPSQPFGMVFKSLKDPEWEDANKVDTKSQSTSINTGGKGQNADPPAPVHMPIPLRHAMEQRVEKAALPEGDRALPQAGLIFFLYRGKTEKIHSLELVYAGPAGTATLSLQP
jgi:hypothetical protein